MTIVSTQKKWRRMAGPMAGNVSTTLKRRILHAARKVLSEEEVAFDFVAACARITNHVQIYPG